MIEKNLSGHKGLLVVFMFISLISSAQTVYNYTYTGAAQSVTLPAGTYQLEVWGAQGWSGTYQGGHGGYSIGNITLSTISTIYIYVGGRGMVANVANTPMGGGWNGGGNGQNNGSNETVGGGGGGTDIRLNGINLSDRIIIAGGGGGATNNSNAYGGYGGGTSGGTGGYSDPGTGGTQSTGGSSGGSLGQGGNALVTMTPWNGGGGGGYYGGGVSIAHGGGGGGSGFVGTLSNSGMIAGNASMPNPSGGTMTGRTSDGYARITSLTITSSVTWVGGTTGATTDWNTATNWSPAVVPTSTIDATIPATGITYYPVVASGTNAAVKNLTNNSTATNSIIVNTGGKLTVSGTYTAVSGAKIKVEGTILQ